MKKRTETNIDKLKNQRQLNVPEQLSVKKNRILKGAKYWKEKGIPEPLKEIFKNHKIEIDKSIMLSYEQDLLGGSTDEGMILTIDGFFYEFDADLNSDRTELIELYSFINVSERFEINSHKKGVGKTYGALAKEVLKELNDTTIIN
ncbi:hypothetical protein Fleli_2376 [Bernardetia litoralis DSM 6794]|uniref:Uncharacterized protein n=1 Tax=Bernardetia litoralis (strain ATCC 23117 / DSM 6794 / NBRC 15988 / NCIMB 1366 / Fx l1 / Sio-4) TaxID=880071 RepID=I4ALB3_BERLS|nr:hypothetical protein [Bernardetia litoralis]AFM04748.1 hypothetical protein Fleli_2376 [Bernardetia litoralis DSM 6794]